MLNDTAELNQPEIIKVIKYDRAHRIDQGRWKLLTNLSLLLYGSSCFADRKSVDMALMAIRDQ